MKRPMSYDIVASLAGHDEGKLFMVVGCQADRLLLCDGRGRSLAEPKKKAPSTFAWFGRAIPRRRRTGTSGQH